jgi:hypothetical protein
MSKQLTRDPGAAGGTPLDAAAIKDKLTAKGYKSPDAVKYITDQVLGKPAAEQQKELEKYTKPPSDKRKELERAASKAQKEKNKANGTTPPSGDPGTFDRIILNDEDLTYQTLQSRTGMMPERIRRTPVKFHQAVLPGS